MFKVTTYVKQLTDLINVYFVNKNSLRKWPQKLFLKSPQKEAFIRLELDKGLLTEGNGIHT